MPKRHTVPHVVTAAPVPSFVGVAPSSPKPRSWEPPFVNIPVVDFLSVTTEPLDGKHWAVTTVLDNELEAERFHNAIAGKLVRLAGTPVTDINGAPVIDANTGYQKMKDVRRVAIDEATHHPHVDPVSGHVMTVVPPLEPVMEADAVMADDEDGGAAESTGGDGGGGDAKTTEHTASPRKSKADKNA